MDWLSAQAGELRPRTPAPGPILLRLRLNEIGAPQFSFEKLSGRRDFAPYTTPAQSHHPLRGLVDYWRPCEFGSNLEPDAMEADPSAEIHIGPPGFEPGTSSTPRKRATRLRYGPFELQIVTAFPAARKPELPPGCCAPHTRPCALRDRLRLG